MTQTHKRQPPALVCFSVVGSGTCMAGWLVCLAPAVWLQGRMVMDESGLTLVHLREAFAYDHLRALLLHTLGVVLVTGLTAVGVGLPVGFLCFRTLVPGRRLFLLVAATMAAIPLYVSATGWMTLLGDVWIT